MAVELERSGEAGPRTPFLIPFIGALLVLGLPFSTVADTVGNESCKTTIDDPVPGMYPALVGEYPDFVPPQNVSWFLPKLDGSVAHLERGQRTCPQCVIELRNAAGYGFAWYKVSIQDILGCSFEKAKPPSYLYNTAVPPSSFSSSGAKNNSTETMSTSINGVQTAHHSSSIAIGIAVGIVVIIIVIIVIIVIICVVFGVTITRTQREEGSVICVVGGVTITRKQRGGFRPEQDTGGATRESGNHDLRHTPVIHRSDALMDTAVYKSSTGVMP